MLWNKIWSKELFTEVRFPKLIAGEDIATVYKAFLGANKLYRIEELEYHYRKRKNGLNHNTDLESLIDFWKACKERYYDLSDKVDDLSAKTTLLGGCVRSIGRVWGHYYNCSLENKEKYQKDIAEMHNFAINNIKLFGETNWNRKTRISAFFSHFNSNLTFSIVSKIYSLYEKNRDENTFM